jgi:hypothetical protein
MVVVPGAAVVGREEVSLVAVLAGWEEVSLVAVAGWEEVALVAVMAGCEEVALVAVVAGWEEVALVAVVAGWEEVTLAVAAAAGWEEVALAVKDFDLVLLLPRMEATIAPKFCYSNQCNSHQVHNQHQVAYKVSCDANLSNRMNYCSLEEQDKSFQKLTSHEGMGTFGKYPQDRNKRIFCSSCRRRQSTSFWRRW